ncbi:MAG: CsgG/HfaB family protein [bacterium]
MRVQYVVVVGLIAAALTCVTGTAVAGSCKVDKDNITFTPASNMGTYIISAPPGTVTGIHPIQVVCLDKDTAEKFEATIHPDGSFTLTVDGTQGDKIKLKFTDSTGDKTGKTLRIPIMSKKSLLDGPQKVVNRKGENPGGPGAPKLVAPSGAVAQAGGGAAAPAAAGPLSLKKIVAVAEFKNKAKLPSRYNLGTGMQAQLINALNRSGKFVVREQELLKDVFGEQDLAQSGRMAESKSARIGKAITAQYLVRGTVTEYDAAEVSDSKGFSIYGVSISGGKSRAHMACIIDLIDTTSGTVIASQRMEGKAEGRGAGGGLSLPYVPGGRIRHGKQKHTPVNKAMQMCIDNCVYFIIQELAKQPWRSTVVKADETGKIIIRGGSEDGMKPGYEFSVYRQGEELRDPTTGELLDIETKKIGRISVTKVKKKIAYATPLMGSGFQAGDLVKVD